MRFEARGRFAVSPEQLWPLLADTQRLNRALGLPVMRFTAQPLPTGGSRVVGEHPIGAAVLALLGQLFPLGAGRLGDERLLRRLPPFPVARWTEHPFEWEAPRRYTVLRDYFWSPLGLFPFRTFRCGVELVRTPDGGALVTAFADIRPRNLLGAILTRFLLGPKNVRSVIAQCRIFEQYLLGRLPDPFPQIAPRSEKRWPEASDGRAPGTREGPGLLGVPGLPEAAQAPQGDLLAPPVRTPFQPAADGALPRQMGEESGGPAGALDEAWPGGASRWQALRRAGVEADLVVRLRRHVLEAPDEDVLDMRPFDLADRWAVDRRRTLVLFLHATTAGLLTMRWEVLCPNCRLPKAAYQSLPDLQGEAHCDYCNVAFDVAIDRQVELRFSVAPAIREVADRRFCSGGPMNAPHVVAQATLQPGETRGIEVRLVPGTYRLRSLQSKTAAILEAGAGAAPPQAGQPPAGPEASVTLAPDAIRPPLLSAAAGTVRLLARNDTNVPAVLAVEHPGWPDTAATAAVVGTIQEFRDLFGSEVLAPGLQLAIERLAFMFTDLSGSTAMYQAVGQARAFRLVQDHFRILRAAIAAHRGAVVKTIGDAIMATFPTGADALAAALAMQHEIRRLDAGETVDTARLLKVGLHEGPCIAVGANGRLDYFGTTVNLASRVEHECRGGEVVLTADLYQGPAVQELLRERGLGAALDVAPAETRLRGIREPVGLFRLTSPGVLAP